MTLFTAVIDIRDIKPPLYFKDNAGIFFTILAALIIVSGVIWLVVFLFRKYKKVKETVIIKEPHEAAYESLMVLKMKNLAQAGRIKEYYIELSAIVRRYIEDRFEIKAPDMTTEEFLLFIKRSSSLVGAHKDLLREFLTLSDIVKFAKYGPTQKEIDESYGAAKTLVDETKDDISRGDKAASQ